MASQDQPRSIGIVYTFYSYKGGVGRSMALANVATLLARMGKNVLVVDFDLEAPGLVNYFGPADQAHWDRKPGIVDLISAHSYDKAIPWTDALHDIDVEPVNRTRPGRLHLISAGIRAASNTDGTPVPYEVRVQSLDWQKLFDQHELGEYLQSLRHAWMAAYDFILIDSRTGISDIGGICTIILPDVLVLLFTANNQSIDGCVRVMQLARRAQERLPEERARLLALPILSRDDRLAEGDQSLFWRGVVAKRMNEYFRDWLPRGTSADEALTRLYLPHVAYWSFGERRPVAERPSDLEDPGSLAAAYQRLAVLIAERLDWRRLAGAVASYDEFEKIIGERDQLRAQLSRMPKGGWLARIFFALDVSATMLALSARLFRDFRKLLNFMIVAYMFVLAVRFLDTNWPPFHAILMDIIDLLGFRAPKQPPSA